ncbi:MAG: hypothetical protein QOF71_1467 [Candidatus Eremiobacteraeota bacterium]|nr:hypothetical protein [Candidatus Eremiobacteraeota bacterium]
MPRPPRVYPPELRQRSSSSSVLTQRKKLWPRSSTSVGKRFRTGSSKALWTPVAAPTATSAELTHRASESPCYSAPAGSLLDSTGRAHYRRWRPASPMGSRDLEGSGSDSRGRSVNVSGWATIFFAELSNRLDRSVSYSPDGAGNFDATEPELRVLGEGDTFMSVWINAGIAWDGPATRKAAVDAAVEVVELIARRRER